MYSVQNDGFCYAIFIDYTVDLLYIHAHYPLLFPPLFLLPLFHSSHTITFLLYINV